MPGNKASQNKILFIIASILLLLFLLSIPKSSLSGKRKAEKTALLNPKYSLSVQEFELRQGEDSLILSRENGIWLAFSRGTPENKLACEQDRVQEFISTLTTIRNLYKISDKIQPDNAFGLTDGSEFHISYSAQEGSQGTELVFGKTDFSAAFRYFMTGRTAEVYETDTTLDRYLTLRTSFWCESELVSGALTGNASEESLQRIVVTSPQASRILLPGKDGWSEGVSRLLTLRHSGPSGYEPEGLPQESEELLSLTMEDRDTSAYSIQIYQTKDNDDCTAITSYRRFSGGEYRSAVKISSWTLESIRQALGL